MDLWLRLEQISFGAQRCQWESGLLRKTLEINYFVWNSLWWCHSLSVTVISHAWGFWFRQHIKEVWLFRKTLSPGAQSIVSCRCLWFTNEPNECHNLLGPWSSLLQDPTSRRQFLITYFFSIQWENRWASALNFADCLAEWKYCQHCWLCLPEHLP